MEKYLEKYPPMLSVAQVAEILNVNKHTVRKQAKIGKIPSLRVGKVIRIPKDRLLEYLNGTV